MIPVEGLGEPTHSPKRVILCGQLQTVIDIELSEQSYGSVAFVYRNTALNLSE